MIERNQYLSKLISAKNNGFPKIITGIRRCGKSYLLKEIFKKHLIETGLSENQIIIIDLDEIKLQAGAGEITIDTLKTQGLYFNLGAGKVHIENIIATKEAKIDGGVGNITINFEGRFKRI